MKTGLKRVDRARESLTAWMIARAERERMVSGFGWVARADAPSTFEGVEQAYRASQVTKVPFPVWNGGSENTIYTEKEGNYAFRFVHDLIHAKEGFEFTFGGEAKAAEALNEEVKREFGKESLEYRLAVADSIGQSVYAETHGGMFPENQLDFVLTLLGEY